MYIGHANGLYPFYKINSFVESVISNSKGEGKERKDRNSSFINNSVHKSTRTKHNDIDEDRN